MSVFFKAYFLLSFFIIAVPVEATQNLINMDVTNMDVTNIDLTNMNLINMDVTNMNLINMDLINMDLKSLITESARSKSRFENFATLEIMIAPPLSKEYLIEVYSIITINMELSRRFFYGIGVEKNERELIRHSIAADSVANHYFDKVFYASYAKNKIEEVVPKEMQKMISSIKQSQNIVQYYGSMMFLKGIEIERNLSMGLSLLKTLADRGYKPAQILLTKIYFSGLYEIKKNNKKALNWAKRAFEGKKFDEATALKKAASIDVELLVLKSATSASKGAKIKPFKLRIFLEAKKSSSIDAELLALKNAKVEAKKAAERRALKRAKLKNGKCRKVFTIK